MGNLLPGDFGRLSSCGRVKTPRRANTHPLFSQTPAVSLCGEGRHAR